MCGSPNADKSHNQVIVFTVKLPDLTPLYTNILPYYKNDDYDDS